MSPLSADIQSALDEWLGPGAERSIDLDGLAAIKDTLDRAADAGEDEMVFTYVRSRPPAPGIHVGRSLLEARLAVGRGDLIAADMHYQPLCEKLNQGEAWAPLGTVAMEWLEATMAHPAARYLVRAWRKGGTEAVPEGFLRRAHEEFPTDPELTWSLASTMEDRGSTREGRRLLASSLKMLGHDKDVARVEEGILRLLEAPEGAVIVLCLEAVDALAHTSEGHAAAGLFEMLMPAVESHHLAGAAWPLVRRALERHPNEHALRPLAVNLLKTARGDLKSLPRMIEVAGLDRLAVPPAQALATLDRILPWAPGFYVEHSGWGLGEIKDNDGEFLTINFPARPGHRMNLKAAAQVLTSLPGDDLKVQISVNLPGLRKMAAEDPPALVAMALRRAGGEAAAPEIRKLLVPAVLSTTEWSAWWKKTKDQIGTDERIDARQAFRSVYRVPQPGDAEEDLELPPLDEPKGVDHNVDLVLSFLAHHPHLGDRVREELDARVRRWADRREADPAERARARLLLWNWDEAGRADHAAAIEDLFEAGFDLSAAGGAEEQLTLLDIGLPGRARNAALELGLNARTAAVREKALEDLWSEPGNGPVDFFAGLLAEPTGHIEALFFAADRVAGRPAGDERLDRLLWPSLIGLIDLLNVTGREPIRKKGLKTLDAGGPLMGRVRELPPDERTELILAARLRDWRASDKVLFPILEAFTAAGLGTVVESVRAKRAAAHARIFQAAPAIDDIQQGPVIMTRHTFDKLHSELERINLELKTVIPQAIRKARELGDLRENAEYEAAKLKQANASKRLAQLDGQLEKVRILEDLTLEEGKAGPGARVTVHDEESGAENTYWILGEGDGDYGPEVISYRAPLGRTLTGHRAGEVVDYVTGEATRKLRLVSVVHQKPPGPPPA